MPEVTKAARWELQASFILTILNIVGMGSFWFSLPEKQKRTEANIADHEIRIRALEQDRGLLQRIDERTKSIQEDVKQVHQDFSFSVHTKP